MKKDVHHTEEENLKMADFERWLVTSVKLIIGELFLTVLFFYNDYVHINVEFDVCKYVNKGSAGGIFTLQHEKLSRENQ